MVGSWRLVAIGSDWWLAVGGGWRLAAVGDWQLAATALIWWDQGRFHVLFVMICAASSTAKMAASGGSWQARVWMEWRDLGPKGPRLGGGGHQAA